MSDEYAYPDEMAELKDAYPEGCVVEIETPEGETWRARVTGYSEVVNDGRIEYANPGVRLLVSDTPPDGEPVEHDLDVSRAAAVPTERIHGRVDDA